MPYGLYISAEGAQAQIRRLEVLSNNMANVDTVGFKRDVTVIQARHAEAISQGLDFPGSRSLDDIGGGVMVHSTATDHTPGILERTGITSDMAIQGEGYFAVRRENEDLLTRAGNFLLSANGTLCTPEGYPVLSSEGEPVVLDPQVPWRVVDGGRIEQAGGAIELKLVRPQQPGDLAKIGENLFRPLASTLPLEAGQRNVSSGYLERSSVKPAAEMMHLIDASRMIEANMTMIKNHDQMLGALINRVLGRGNA